MLRSPSGRGQDTKEPAAAEALGLAGDEEVPRLGRDLAAEADAILREDGASPEALRRIGAEVVALARRWRRFGESEPLPRRQAGEYPLWCEDDGTFELVLRLLDGEQDAGPGLGYDTWTVCAPLQGRLRVLWIENGVPRSREVAPGHSLGVPAGCASLPAASDRGGATLLCLFGISRLLLPPPVQLDCSTRWREGAAP